MVGSDPRMASLGNIPRDPVNNWTQGKSREILEVSPSQVSSSLGSFPLFPLPQPSTIGLYTIHCSETLSLFLTCSYLFAYFISTADFNSDTTAYWTLSPWLLVRLCNLTALCTFRTLTPVCSDPFVFVIICVRHSIRAMTVFVFIHYCTSSA